MQLVHNVTVGLLYDVDSLNRVVINESFDHKLNLRNTVQQTEVRCCDFRPNCADLIGKFIGDTRERACFNLANLFLNLFHVFYENFLRLYQSLPTFVRWLTPFFQLA